LGPNIASSRILTGRERAADDKTWAHRPADDVGAGRLTPDEAQTIAAIVGKRAELFAWSSLRPRLTP
jgi:hypothetical protein